MKKKTKKTTKKTTKTKKVAKLSPFDFAMDAEQALAEKLCDKFLDNGNPDNIDDAFIGAFHSLSHRMLTQYKKGFLLEIIEEMSQIDGPDEEHDPNNPAVKELVVSTEAKNRMH